MRSGCGVVLCLLAVVHSYAWGAPGSASKAPAKRASTVVTLPLAHSGQPYVAILAVVSSIPYGRAQCTLNNAPSWLTFDQGHFQFSGIPEEQAPVTTYSMKLTMTDMDNNKTQVLDLTLRIVSGPEIVYADPKLASKADVGKIGVGGPGKVIPASTSSGQGAAPTSAATQQSAPGSQTTAPSLVIFETIDPILKITSQVLEGSTSISGEVERIPAGAIEPLIEVWIAPNGQQPYQAQLTAADSEGNPEKVTEIPLTKAQEFTANLVTPLAAGQKVRIELVAPRDSGLILKKGALSLVEFDLPTEIPLPEIFIPQDLTAGTQSITGYVKGLPNPPILANTADATPGNLPLLSAEIDDPQNGKSLAGFQLSLTDTETAVQVGKDGSFSLHLAKALTAGQKVRMIPVAPKGHHFIGAEWAAGPNVGKSFPGADNPQTRDGRNVQAPIHEPLKVYTALAISEPIITSALSDNATAISGTATASAAGGTSVNVAVLRLHEGEPAHEGRCPTADELIPITDGRRSHDDYELLTGTAGTTDTVATSASGAFSLTLANPMHEGELIQIVQVLPAETDLFKQQKTRCYSKAYEVPSTADWGRVHAEFTAGLLISNNSLTTLSAQGGQSQDNGDFSQAHEFLALTVDKSWSFPACYLRRFADEREHPGRNYDECYNWHTGAFEPAERWQHLWPGVSTFFDARLTSIPVSTLSTTTSASSSSAGSGGTNGTTSTLSASNQLTSAQTARLGVGLYFPFLITRWDYHHEPNALFFAPLAKIGFDTVTGPSSQTVVLPGGGIGALNLENLYNFYAFGGRLGHFHMTNSLHRAPQTFSYLDVVVGPFSNLQSYVCRRTILLTTTNTNGTTTVAPAPGYPAATNNTGSTCAADYPSLFDVPVPAGTVPGLTAGSVASYAAYDSRKRLYRLDFEGMLKIPDTPLYVGFNANLGQKSAGAQDLDHGYAAPDDLRFLFGTRFDIGAALAKLGVNPF